MRSLLIVCLVGGCSVIGQQNVKTTCTQVPPVVDTAVALAGLYTAVSAVRGTDADARAHGQVDRIHMLVTLPSLVYAFSAVYGFTEANACTKRTEQRSDRSPS
jgi:hypothetical protein